MKPASDLIVTTAERYPDCMGRKRSLRALAQAAATLSD
jgi:phage protein U